MIPIKDMPCEMKLIGDDIGKGQKNKAYITVTWPEIHFKGRK